MVKLGGGEGLKLVPTLNLADPISLSSWVRMRRLVLEYGSSFYRRHLVFLNLGFVVFVVSGVTVFMGGYFKTDYLSKVQLKEI